MWTKRLAWALAGLCAALLVAGAVQLWKTHRVLTASAVAVRDSGVVRFRALQLDTRPPAGFETIPAPGGFRDAASYSGRLFVAGDGGLFEYDAGGALLHQYRAGLELPPARVTSLAVGPAGAAGGQALWAATAGAGALIFDGANFRQIVPEPAAARKLTCLLPLATGRVLYGSDGGVLAFDGERLQVLDASLGALHVTALAGSEANLWIGTGDSGVWNWHAGALDHISAEAGLPDPRVFAIATDGDTAYAATALGIAQLRGGRLERVLAPGFTVQSLAKQAGELLAGTLDEGLLHVPLDAREKPSVAEAGTSIRRVLALDGTAYALTPGGMYRVAGWKPVLKSEAARLADRNISAIARDGRGALWIGYFDRGLDILRAGGGEVRHIEDDVIFCVNRIVDDPVRGRTAVATSNGLALFSPAGDKRQVLTRADGLIASQVTDLLFRADGSMVAATPAGASFIDKNGISSVYAFHGLVNNHVYALGQTGGRTLVGTLGGLSVMESGLVTASFTTANSHLSHNWVTALAEVDGETFLGTYGGGIFHSRGQGWESFADLPRLFVVNPGALAASPRAVYAGTLANGLAVFDRASRRWRWVVRGLPSTNVTAVAAADGQLLVGTENGLVRVAEDALLKAE